MPNWWARERTTALEGHRMTAVASIIVGLALIGSTILTTKGETFWVQGGFAILFLLLGFGGIALCQIKLREIRPLL
jgi:hypothetical protein